MGGPLRISALCKSGIYGNSASQKTHQLDIADQTVEANRNQATFMGEAGGVATYDVNCHLSFRASCQAMWIENVALAPEQIAGNDFGNACRHDDRHPWRDICLRWRSGYGTEVLTRRLKPKQFRQRPGEFPELRRRHRPGIPARRDRPRVARVVQKRHGDETIEVAAKLEQFLGGQRHPIAQHVVGEDKQPAKTGPEQRLPLGEAASRRAWTSSSSRTSHKTTPPLRFVFTWRDLPHIPQGYERAAASVTELFKGEPVASVDVAKTIGMDPASGNATRALCRAERAGLVRRVDRSNWLPCTKEQKPLDYR